VSRVPRQHFFALLGTKKDLEEKRVVQREEAAEYARKKKMFFFDEVSTLDLDQSNTVFESLMAVLMKMIHRGEIDTDSTVVQGSIPPIWYSTELKSVAGKRLLDGLLSDLVIQTAA
jgi:hypothetical protein